MTVELWQLARAYQRYGTIPNWLVAYMIVTEPGVKIPGLHRAGCRLHWDRDNCEPQLPTRRRTRAAQRRPRKDA